MQGLNQEGEARFRVESSNGTYESRVLAVAIGIFGRPNKPKEYRLLPSLKERLLFDMTSHPIQTRRCWSLVAVTQQRSTFSTYSNNSTALLFHTVRRSLLA
jgi:hypothetical protein